MQMIHAIDGPGSARLGDKMLLLHCQLARRRIATATVATKRAPSVKTPCSLTEELCFDPEAGLGSFLSARTTSLLVESLRTQLQTASQLAVGTANTLTVKDLFHAVERAERDPAGNARLLNHAAQAWNLSFFLQGLSEKPTEPVDSFVRAIERDFGSWAQFRRRFEAQAAGMLGCGWVWLVDTPDAGLRIVSTWNGATPLFKRFMFGADKSGPVAVPRHQLVLDALKAPLVSPVAPPSPNATSNIRNTPVLALNLWEHAFVLDYGLDRTRYVANWWNWINWNRAAVILNTY